MVGGTEVQLATTVTDEDTGSLQYQWHANGGDFSNAAIQNPTWTAPDQVTARKSYTLTVIVTDNGNLTDSFAVTITVRPDQEPPNPNSPPIVTIVTQRQTVGGGAEVELEATVTDPAIRTRMRGQARGHSRLTGRRSNLLGPRRTRLSSAQAIVLTLTVTDSGGLEDTKTVTMTVSGNTIPNVQITGDRQEP